MPEPPRSTARASRLAVRLDRNVGWWVVGAAIGGVLLASSALWGLDIGCSAHRLPGRICSTEASRSLWTVLSGLAAVPALMLTWYWKTKQRFREITVSEYQEITTRFAKAVELLGSQELAQSLGGIYTLGRLAEDSGRDRQVVADTLCAYLRSLPGESYADAQAAAMEEYQYPEIVEPRGIDERRARVEACLQVLARIRTSGALFGARLDDVTLRGLDARNLDFTGASMQACRLVGCDLHDALFLGADLRGARFAACKLGKVAFCGAKLSGAEFVGCDLSGATYDAQTEFPDGFDAGGAGMVKVATVDLRSALVAGP